MMTTIDGKRVPIVPRQLSTGQWIAERSPTCFGLGNTPDEALSNLSEPLSFDLSRRSGVRELHNHFKSISA